MQITLDPILRISLFYLLAMYAGHYIVRFFLYLVRKSTFQDNANEPLNAWIGCTERFVAVTLVIIAPMAVGPFILAWVTAKIAANWQRRGGGEAARKGTLTALLGNSVSFAIAIWAGVYLNHNALNVWSGVQCQACLSAPTNASRNDAR